MSAFVVQSGAVWMVGHHAPWRMSEAAVDSFLDTFELNGAAELFNALYAAAQEAYGTDFIPRRSCLRLVSDNSPESILRARFAASVEDLLAAEQLEPRTL